MSEANGVPAAYELYIAGEWSPATGGRRTSTINPFSGEPWATVPDATASDVDRAVRAARAALSGPWGDMTGFDRARLLRRLAELVQEQAEDLGVIETRDNGKLLREMAGQTAYLAEWFLYFAGWADKLQGRTIPSDRPNYFVYTRREPVGVVGAIVPWNSPLLLLGWKLAPALATGCTFVVKPSDFTPVSTLAFAGLVEEAGFPAGVFNVVTGVGPEVGEALASHPGVDCVAFTGSTQVGRKVAAAAATRLARSTLELGGKSAQIVFADSDLVAAANGVIAGIFAATGQTCLAGSRLLVEASVREELLAHVVKRAETIVLGDPAQPETEMGPLSNAQQLETVARFVDEAREQGAEVLTGGRQPELGGFFYEPTIVAGVNPDQRIWREEIFGPVVAVSDFDTEDQAVELANDSDFGLGAGVWTRDVQRAHRVAHRLQAGNVFVNSYRLVAPNVPFGGLKQSGWGRENGEEALAEFTETKAVWVELSGETRDPFVLG